MSLFSAVVVHAANFDIYTGIPGPVPITGAEGYGILGYIQNAYLLALGVAGALAIGSIIYGAVQYTASKGNPSKLSDAWDRIVQALVGLLLLVGAGTLLSIVNPGLLSLELPKIEKVDTPFSGETYSNTISEEDEDRIDPNTGKPTSNDPTSVPATVSCKTDANKCTSLHAKGFTCAVKKEKCLAHQQTVAALECAARKVGITNADIRVTEGYPPSFSHVSSGHNNGCIVDVTLSKAYKQGGCAAIKAFEAAVNSCGGYALNEYAGVDRDGGNFAGCGVKPINRKTGKISWTGNNVHVRGCPNGTLP